MIRLAICLWFFAWPVQALTCLTEAFEKASFTRCTVNPAKDDLRLFWRGTDDQPLGFFSNLKSFVQSQNLRLKFAMNAGMFRTDLSPAGHYVEQGTQYRQVMRKEGPGNFGMLPNGVFCKSVSTARVYETNDFVQQSPACEYATQSGPMLVIDGKLHPRFLENSTSKFIRNGVGTSDHGNEIHFVISNTVVTFHQFARYFKDRLGINNALYLDGNVSNIFAPAIIRFGVGRPVGPMFAVVEPAGE